VTARIVGGEERRGAREEVNGGPVGACECPEPGVREQDRRAVGEPSLPLADRPELGPVAVRLLEVVADDLLVAAPFSLQPVREAGMKLRSRLLGHPRVCRVPHELVTEAERVADDEHRPDRSDQLLPHQALKRRADLLARVGQLSDRARPEFLSDHRGAFEDRAFVGLEPVEPRGEQRLDRRRHRDLAVGLPR
jgi:hypothetical protein